jgi:hypothetical protein
MANNLYPVEKHEYDDGQMLGSVEELEAAMVGHRIVSVGRHRQTAETLLILDNGHTVAIQDTSDCCAYTELNSFILHADKIQHVITGVGTTDGFTTWHIYADLGDVMELDVGWSCGNPFYYGYGFNIRVKETDVKGSN